MAWGAQLGCLHPKPQLPEGLCRHGTEAGSDSQGHGCPSRGGAVSKLLLLPGLGGGEGALTVRNGPHPRCCLSSLTESHR